MLRVQVWDRGFGCDLSDAAMRSCILGPPRRACVTFGLLGWRDGIILGSVKSRTRNIRGPSDVNKELPGRRKTSGTVPRVCCLYLRMGVGPSAMRPRVHVLYLEDSLLLTSSTYLRYRGIHLLLGAHFGTYLHTLFTTRHLPACILEEV
jgi:hypothetical protein